MSSIYWSQQTKTYETHFDIIIIGGGFVGLSTAYWLKKKSPKLKLAIIEKDSIGAGASGRNAGFLTKGSLIFYSHLYESWGEETANNLFNYAHDSIHLAVNELELTQKGVAVPTSSWTFVRSDNTLEKISQLPDSLKKRFQEVHLKNAPLHQQSPMKAAFKEDHEFSINPHRLLSLLEQSVRDQGVEFILGAQVERITSIDHPRLETSYGEISCDKLMVCTNGYSYLLPELAVDIIPQRAQMLAMKLTASIFPQGLFYDPEERVYFKFDKPGHLLIGGKRLVDAEKENTTDMNTSIKIQEALYNYVKNELKLTGEKLASWSGTMGFTKSEIPYVGELSHLKSCFIAAGFSGHGMGWGFKTAKEMSLYLLEKNHQPLLSKIK